MIRRSTFPSRFSMTSILSDTFAPPRIATNGRSGDSSAWPRYCSSFSISSPAAGRSTWCVIALDRGVRAVRRAERVVHVAIGERRQRLRERRVVLLLFGMEAQVLEQHDTACARCATCCTAPRACVADAVGGERHRRAEELREAIRDRPQADLRVRPCPSGARDGWRARRSRPGRARSWIVGSDARIRVSSPMRRPSAGR